MGVSIGKRGENERARVASTQRSATSDALVTVRGARDAVQLAEATANKLQELAAEGKQAAMNLQRDLRNAPGAADASNEARDAASRALDEIARAHDERLRWLAHDVQGATRETSAAAERSAPAAEQEHTLETTKSAVHAMIRGVEDELSAQRRDAAVILVDAARSADDRARDLRSLADRATPSAVRFAVDEGTDADRARENAERTGASLDADEGKALDAALRDALGEDIGNRLDDGAKARLVIAARRDLARRDDGGNVVRQLRDELAALALDTAERRMTVQYTSEATERLSRGNNGERLAAEALPRKGFEIASYKPDVDGTNQGGADIVALRRNEKADQVAQREHVYLIDNKALTRAGNVNSVSALTTNLEQNVRAVAEDFARLLHSDDSNDAQREVARRVLSAIAENRIRLAVTNANIAPDERFTKGTGGRAGHLEFIDLVRDEPVKPNEQDATLKQQDKQKAAVTPAASPPTRIAVAQADVRRAAEAFAAEWARRHEEEVAALTANRAAAASAEDRLRVREDDLARMRADDAAAQRRNDAQREAARVLAERRAVRGEEKA